MVKVKSFKIEDKEYIARELTVRQIKEILDFQEGGPVSVNTFDLLFPDRLPAQAVAMSLGIEEEELDADLPPSALEKMLEEVEGVNPTFAGLIKRLAKVGRTLAERSTEQPAG